LQQGKRCPKNQDQEADPGTAAGDCAESDSRPVVEGKKEEHFG
jgi:hypothetical protein